MARQPAWKTKMSSEERLEYNIQATLKTLYKFRDMKGTVNEKWRKAMVKYNANQLKQLLILFHNRTGEQYNVYKPIYIDLLGLGQKHSKFNRKEVI